MSLFFQFFEQLYTWRRMNQTNDSGQRHTQGGTGEVDEALRGEEVSVHREVRFSTSHEVPGWVGERVRHEAAADGSTLRVQRWIRDRDSQPVRRGSRHRWVSAGELPHEWPGHQDGDGEDAWLRKGGRERQRAIEANSNRPSWSTPGQGSSRPDCGYCARRSHKEKSDCPALDGRVKINVKQVNIILESFQNLSIYLIFVIFFPGMATVESNTSQNYWHHGSAYAVIKFMCRTAKILKFLHCM